MTEKGTWENSRPDLWRSGTAQLGLDETEMEALDRRVHKEGPGALPRLKEIVANDDASDRLRYRAMAWMVSLYGEPDVDGAAVAEALKKVVQSNLHRGGSQPRQDALMALGRIHRHAWGKPPDLSYLLELAGKPEVSREVKEEVLLALAETRSPEAIRPLALGILESRQPARLAEGMRTIDAGDWTDKAAAFLEFITKRPVRGSEVDARAVVHALSPSWGEDPIRRRAEIAHFFIEQSRNRDEREAGVLARLLIECEGGDQIQAGHRLNEYQKDRNIPAEELEALRGAVGGAPAISGIRGQLRKDLEVYFQKPIHELNENTRQSWQKAIDSASKGLEMRLWMSGIVFAVGIVLLLASSMRMLLGKDPASFGPATLVPFIAGLGTMLLIIFTGPLQEIRQAVIDLATASTAFIAYVHRVLQDSHTFSFHYTHDTISFERMEKSSAILKEAMFNTIDALDREARSTSQRTIAAALENLQGIVRGTGGADPSEARSGRPGAKRQED